MSVSSEKEERAIRDRIRKESLGCIDEFMTNPKEIKCFRCSGTGKRIICATCYGNIDKECPDCLGAISEAIANSGC